MWLGVSLRSCSPQRYCVKLRVVNMEKEIGDACVLDSEGERRGRRYRLSPHYALDFPSKNSDINGLGELDSA